MEIDSHTFMQAAKLAKGSNLRINGALIAEQALELSAKIFTDDKDFKRVKELEVVLLR